MKNNIILILIVSLITLSSVNVMGSGIGLEAAIAGGPMLAIVGIADLNDRLSFNLPIGGYPGIIMRAELNLRLCIESTWENWTPFIEGGLGYTKLLRGEREGENMKDIHFNIGISKPWRSSWEISFDAGLLYAPRFLNPTWDYVNPDVLPIVPMIGFGLVYKM